MPKSEGYVSPQYLRLIASFTRGFKNEGMKKAGLKKDDYALDLGCGPAIDTIEMAKIVGPKGKVFGIDIDEEMIDLANEEAAQQGLSEQVSHMQGDVAALPFEDDTFGFVRAERLFQVIPRDIDVTGIFAEVYRILKPGGVFVALDIDWATATIDYPDAGLERKLMSYFALQKRPNGTAAREFYRWFKEGSFSDVSVATDVYPNKSIDETPFGRAFAMGAVEDGVMSTEEAEAWLQLLSERSKQGTYYGTSNFVTVTGRK